MLEYLKSDSFVLLDSQQQQTTSNEITNDVSFILFNSLYKSPILLTLPSGYHNYSCKTILLFYLNMNSDYTTYLTLSIQLSIPQLSIQHRHSLLEYFKSPKESSLSDYINPFIPSNTTTNISPTTHNLSHPSNSSNPSIQPTNQPQPSFITPSNYSQSKPFINYTLSREHSLQDSCQILLIKTSRTFESIRLLAQEFHKPSSKKVYQPHSSSNKPSNVPSKSIPKSNKSVSSNIPIILIPAAIQSLITLYNAQDLFIHQKYIPSEEYRNKGLDKPTQLIIERDISKLIPGLPSKYKIIDSVDKLDPKDWDSIVAVFALGQEWQFKGWKWSKPVDIFNNVCGFALKFTDEPIKPTIQSWKVEQLNINRTKRYLDSTVVFQFWKSLDAWMLNAKKEFK